MALIDRQFLKNEANRRFANITKSLSSQELLFESKKIDQHYDVFLSHSYLDATEIKILKALIEEKGLTVYVDWIEDYELDRNHVTKETAALIRHRMRNCDSLFYAFSENSTKSKWMPWELGYFDGFKGRVAIIPIKENPQFSDNYKGVEFVSLYPYVSITNNKYGISTGYINENENTYVTFNEWKVGRRPYKR